MTLSQPTRKREQYSKYENLKQGEIHLFFPIIQRMIQILDLR